MSQGDNHILTDTEIHAYVQHEAGNTEYFKMSDAEALAIKGKIEANDINKARYSESKRLYDEIGQSLEDKPVRRTNSYLMIAASIAVILTISYFTFFNSSTINQPDTEILAANFTVNEELENLVNYPVRGVEITNVTPENGDKLEGDVVLSWEWHEQDKLEIHLYNNKGDLLFTRSGTSPMNLNEDWTAGLYYWSLANEDETIHWGKFEFYPDK